MKMLNAMLMAAMLAFVGVAASAETAANAAVAVPSGAAASSADPAARPRAPRRVQMTSERRAEMMAQREKYMADRKAARQAKALEIVKKYIPDEEKAKALVAELEEALMPVRRVRAAKKPAAKKD